MSKVNVKAVVENTEYGRRITMENPIGDPVEVRLLPEQKRVEIIQRNSDYTDHINIHAADLIVLMKALNMDNIDGLYELREVEIKRIEKQ